MANDLENQSADTPEDVLPYAFIEDAISEGDALESVGQEDPDADGGAGMSALVVSPASMESFKALTDEMSKAIMANANVKMILANPLVNARVGG
ncbi:hypothetical protein [Polynucleobacter sp. Fuers-14]|uniref:hypothetical protein n=1 Tax=Polynucleobacter sp. Fuers-14 TaxID=1758364 RepID=UPI001C0E2938|nr:hypothetical protein [Polynucleobacter sp. Fuers-14]MBU3640973.1 hypothetical protein [Polynucleobacter sp. Fuers-14]